MIPLITVANGFQARVIAARLGAAGVVAQLHGAVGGPYPIGDVRIEVPADEFEFARELLLVDEVEAAFDPSGDAAPARSRSKRAVVPWVIIGSALVTEAVALAARFG
jgi:hypothetical protein